MASIIKVDKLQEKTTGSGITLEAGLKNSSGTEIVSSTGSLTPTTITTTGNVSVGGNLTSTGNISPSGNFVVANGQGIDFSAVSGSNAGSSSALLDDYEEGIFTINVKGSNDSSWSAVPGTRVRGEYTKIGNIVHLSIFIEDVSFPTFSGNLEIQAPFVGKEFTQGRSGDCYFYPLASWDTYTDFNGFVGNIYSTNNSIVLSIKRKDGDRQAFLNSTNTTVSGSSGIYLRFNLTYFTE